MVPAVVLSVIVNRKKTSSILKCNSHESLQTFPSMHPGLFTALAFIDNACLRWKEYMYQIHLCFLLRHCVVILVTTY